MIHNANTNILKPLFYQASTSFPLLMTDVDIIKDMIQIVIGETPLSQQSDIREELRKLVKDVGSQAGGDFQALALMLVQLRNSQFDEDHFISLP